jgi:hypothetical protein
MAKRFTSTEKWDDPWFRQLPPKMKCAWQFICDKCNIAGFWKIDIPAAAFFIGEPITIDEILNCFNKGKNRVKNVSLEELYIIDFVPFQYGDISKSKHPFHQKIHTLCHRVLDKVEDRAKEEEEVKEEVKEEEITIPEHLKEIWPSFIEMRKTLRKPPTIRAQLLLIKKLKSLSPLPDEQIKIVEQSIANSYQGVFPLKTDRQKYGRQEVPTDQLKAQAERLLNGGLQ